MIIGGYAIGRKTGFCIYPCGIPAGGSQAGKGNRRRLESTVSSARISSAQISASISISGSAQGAFVCGEETALIRSIEGGRGMPRPRPPYPSVEGLFGKPTLINNVETWANIPVVILDSGKWFSSIGTEKSKGTKVFALAGKVVNTGLIEVPMGTTLRKLFMTSAAGYRATRNSKRYRQAAHPADCLPAKYLDTPVDYESLGTGRLHYGFRRHDCR